jgi:hypothetical protein
MTPQSRETPLFLSIPTAAKLMGITPERLTKAIAAHQIPAIVIGARKLVARATIEKLAQLERAAA